MGDMKTFFAVLLSFLLAPGSAHSYYTLTFEEDVCIQDRIALELSLNPAYVWGASSLDPGAPGDCSGKIYAIFVS